MALNSETEADVNAEYSLATTVGLKVAEVLQLRCNKEGRYDTSWGSKTLVGLGSTVLRVIQDAKAEVNLPKPAVTYTLRRVATGKYLKDMGTPNINQAFSHDTTIDCGFIQGDEAQELAEEIAENMTASWGEPIEAVPLPPNIDEVKNGQD